MKTGTARYFCLFLEECGELLTGSDSIIVTPSEFGPIGTALKGIPVVSDCDYRPCQDETIIAFVANNRFHRFIFPLLDRRDQSARVISIIHDPQSFRNIDLLHRSSPAKDNERGMRDHLKYEMPNFREGIMKRWLQDRPPEILKFNLMAQSKIIDASDAIIMHSYYGALRLVLESGHGADAMPPILVMQHPKDPSVKGEVAACDEDKFVVGCFGWLNQSKRPIPVVKGFSRFLSGLTDPERQLVQLKFVGELSEKYLDPALLAKTYGCEKNCVHLGHVPDSRFLQEMSSVHLLFNLRFPSCGETSGTLNLAKEMGVRVAMTNYQAFREEDADFLITLSPDKEVDEICAAIRTVYQDWLEGKPRSTRQSSHRYALPKKFDARQAMEWAVNYTELAT